ncbi:MAG: hypothetical protein CME24_13815 [Gemmatimonadetes bacterium]|nr:hypothetical protein [Gemmatimonadota bacterium]MED5413719.1 hypothetical protein [Candidatus Latescibacterota bacterium]MEE3040073.1 hypothetical protein [Candidatus Latescibacterota bacterium]MEE3263778.1 hypothetical protein [Candidatus Latescibacterota bacterium]
MTTAMGRVRRWARRRSLSMLPVGTTCCAAELDAAMGPAFDPPHKGIDIVTDPGVADLLVVAGRISQPLAEELVLLYEAMPSPATVIAFGACAMTGGAWGEHGETVDLSTLMAVDIHILGCAPPPQHLYEAIERLRHDQ